MSNRADAVEIWQAAVDAVGGKAATRAGLEDVETPDKILAVGKAAGAMAIAALEQFGDIPTVVVTKDGHGDGLPRHVTLIEAAHPVPDARSVAGGAALREAVSSMPIGSRLLLLVSGGASALAEDPVEGKTLDDLKELNTRLLAEGLDITAMNKERRKYSRIKGGGLLAAFKGHCVTVLAISDVPGDDLAVIGSGIGAAPQNPEFTFRAKIVASNAIARHAAERAAHSKGFTVEVNAETLHADLETLASRIGTQLRNMPPGVLVLGGEPTVVLPPNPGRGGRNQALALALAREIQGIRELVVVVGGTDGTDGPTDAAGGIVDGATWDDDAEIALKNADSGRFLEKKDALLKTGPTGTNVMDVLVAIKR